MLKALIAADDFLVRAGIGASIPWTALDIVLVGEAGDCGEAWSLFQQYDPGILIIDTRMPGSPALLRDIRAAYPGCAVIALAESDEAAEELRAVGVSRVLIRLAAGKDDLAAAAEQAAGERQPRSRLTAGKADAGQTGVWREFLFGKGCGRLPFRAMAITGIRMFSEGRDNMMMQHSLNEMMLQKTGCAGAFVHFQQSGCRILVWKEPPEKFFSETTFMEEITEAMNAFHIRIGYAMIPEITNGIRLPAAARKMTAILRDPRLFDRPVMFLDENAAYRHRRLDDLRHEFEVSEPFCRQNAEFMELKEMLDRYPEGLTEGFSAAAGYAQPLLQALEISGIPDGLEEMTGQICERAEIRLRNIIPAFRPQIRKVMETIRLRLPEHISREELSRAINYDSAYFSRLFKQETGMNYIDYLFEMRMLRAMNRVGHTDDSFSEIAREVGFPNTSYFFRRFRQFCGTTPGEWREQVTKRV